MTFLSSKNGDITSKLHDYNIKYDPKIGLIFKKVQKSDVSKIGTLTCKGTMSGKTSLAKFSLMVVQQIRLREPVIERASIYNYPVQNGTSTFTCTNLVTNFDKGTDFDVGKIRLVCLKSKCIYSHQSIVIILFALNIVFLVWNYDSLEDSSSRVTTTKNKIVPVYVAHKISNLVKNLSLIHI